MNWLMIWFNRYQPVPAIWTIVDEAEQFANRALDLMADLPSSVYKDELVSLTENSIIRKN